MQLFGMYFLRYFCVRLFLRARRAQLARQGEDQVFRRRGDFLDLTESLFRQ